MTQRNDTRLGILLMVAVTVVFALQDGLSRHLAGSYNVYMIVMLRFWFFAVFAAAVAARQAGSLTAAARTPQPLLQILRGLILCSQICVLITAFVLLGLVETHAIFAASPLIIAALSGPILGERVGWRRWAAIGIGLIGVLVILRPGSGVFSPAALVAMAAAAMFALYGLLTRYAARKDSAATSFFWTGVVGAVVLTPIGLWHWQPMAAGDWALMCLLMLTGAAGHFMLIKCYEVAEASAVQPFAYLQLVFVTIIGFAVFHERVGAHVVIGAAIVVGAGLFTLWRERMARKPG